MNATELTPELATLLNSARTLSSDLVREVTDFAEFLGRKHTGVNGKLSNEGYDDWTEEDMRAATIASFRRFEEEHPNDDWGEDFTSPGGTSCSPQVT